MRKRPTSRRFCGYPAYGAGAAGFQTWRFYQAYGLLEYRMNNLSDVRGGGRSSLSRHAVGARGRIPEAAGHLDTDGAAVWSRNPNELRDRTRLFDDMAPPALRLLRHPAGAALGDAGLTLVV